MIKITPQASLPTIAQQPQFTQVDAGQSALHYELPQEAPAGSPSRIRIYPAPSFTPDRIALRLGADASSWHVFRGSPALDQTDPDRGLLFDLNAAPTGLGRTAPASANLVPIRHGETTSVTVGSGNALRAHQRLAVPDSPIAYDADADGNIVPSLVLRVDGVFWSERPTFFSAGPVEEFVPELESDGGITALFGDGTDGERLPTGRGNVRATYRVGGGLAGEVPSGAIDTLVGSVSGVQRIAGVGPTSGGADQDDERRMRAEADALFVGDTWVPDVEGPLATGLHPVHLWRKHEPGNRGRPPRLIRGA